MFIGIFSISFYWTVFFFFDTWECPFLSVISCTLYFFLWYFTQYCSVFSCTGGVGNDLWEEESLSVHFCGKEHACQFRRCKRCRFDPWVSRIPREGNGHPLQYSCLENPIERWAWWLQSMWSWRVGHDWNDLAYSTSLPIDCKFEKCYGPGQAFKFRFLYLESVTCIEWMDEWVNESLEFHGRDPNYGSF